MYGMQTKISSQNNDGKSLLAQKEPQIPSSWVPKIGETVFVPSINATAKVVSTNRNGNLTLHAGLMTMKATVDQVRPL
jgi:dsDNA-specific endonuclease/ATPase MutS2